MADFLIKSLLAEGGPRRYLVMAVSCAAERHLQDVFVEQCDLAGLIHSLQYHGFIVERWDCDSAWEIKELERLANL